jgi:hypothetical protein
MVTIPDCCESLKYKVYREDVHGTEIVLIKAVEIHPRKLLICR